MAYKPAPLDHLCKTAAFVNPAGLDYLSECPVCGQGWWFEPNRGFWRAVTRAKLEALREAQAAAVAAADDIGRQEMADIISPNFTDSRRQPKATGEDGFVCHPTHGAVGVAEFWRYHRFRDGKGYLMCQLEPLAHDGPTMLGCWSIGKNRRGGFAGATNRITKWTIEEHHRIHNACCDRGYRLVEHAVWGSSEPFDFTIHGGLTLWRKVP